MREKVKDRGRLEHILEAINEIQEYKSQYTLEDVKNSKLVFYGFTKFVEVIGEAVQKLWQSYSVASYIPASWGRGAWGESGALFGKRDGVIRKILL